MGPGIFQGFAQTKSNFPTFFFGRAPPDQPHCFAILECAWIQNGAFTDLGSASTPQPLEPKLRREIRFNAHDSRGSDK